MFDNTSRAKGPQAAQQEMDLAYKQALQAGEWKGKIDISLLLDERRTSRRAFQSPDGKSVGLHKGLGLSSGLNATFCTHVTRDSPHKLVLRIQGTKEDGSLRSANVEFHKSGEAWSLVTATTVSQEKAEQAQEVLRKAYEEALRNGSWTGKLDISRLVTSDGKTQNAFLDPDSKSVGQGNALGLA